MEHNIKPITKQLVIATLILTLVTVASLGIRQFRFRAHRTRTTEEGPAIAETEPDNNPTNSNTVDAEHDPQYADAPEPDQGEFPEYQAEVKSFKSGFVKAKGPKGLEKISLGDNANLYITKEGQTWYAGKGPDGTPFKMQVQIDEATGEMTVVGRVYGGKSDGSQGLQKISMGGSDNLYITREGELWYTSEGSKSRVEIDEATGEITVIEQYSGDDDK
ncbi:MAG: hypothetical protein CEE38_16040 [Planctomycetes bacterium B3_Pla]|nr:MAG: hypothetical protein CEE38_16040 [Planctomycetes bacterium B3_Pla]